MAQADGCIVKELCWGEVRSIAIHFPTRRREHRVTSVPGCQQPLAEALLDFIRGLPDRDSLSKADLKSRCDQKRLELSKALATAVVTQEQGHRPTRVRTCLV